MLKTPRIWTSVKLSRWTPNFWDLFALLVIFAVFAFLASSALHMAAPYQLGVPIPIELGLSHLPEYVLRTTVRLFLGLLLSLFFTFTVGYLVAKNKHAERVIIPFIDILQSVPVLGFLSITLIAFIALFPNRLLGPECAAIFAIFTCQTWNMTLGFYQSLRTVPTQLREASAVFRLSGWQRFWKIEVPFAIPSLIWNTMISLSGSWFFITISEAITVNNQEILLPGIGSYIAVAVKQTNQSAVIYAILAMFVVIFLYDQLIFRPLVTWSEKFKSEESMGSEPPSRTFLMRLVHYSRVFKFLGTLTEILWSHFVNLRWRKSKEESYATSANDLFGKIGVFLWYGIISIITIFSMIWLTYYVYQHVPADEVSRALLLGLYTCIRVIILIVICAVIWVPIGVCIGLHPRAARIVQPIAQFLAAFPANLLFPAIVFFIIKFNLNHEIWMSPLMILGTQWYILFNVIAGTIAMPKDLVQAAHIFGLKRWLWWKKLILPAIFPYVITGAITAAGGAWNASIVAESMHWGKTLLDATGLGAYISNATALGDFPREALGIGVMCLYVITFNRLVWQPLYNLAEKRFQLD